MEVRKIASMELFVGKSFAAKGALTKRMKLREKNIKEVEQSNFVLLLKLA